MGLKDFLQKQRTERRVKQAGKLADLRRQRIEAEGDVKIARIEEKERAKLKAARSERFQRSPTGKLLSGFRKGLVTTPKIASAAVKLTEKEFGGTVKQGSKKKGNKQKFAPERKLPPMLNFGHAPGSPQSSKGKKKKSTVFGIEV